MNSVDATFLIITFIVCIILIKNESHKVKMIGWIVLSSHIWKEIAVCSGVWSGWPFWAEIVSLCIAFMLISEGVRYRNGSVVVIGCVIGYGHTRQIVTGDDIYY